MMQRRFFLSAMGAAGLSFRLFGAPAAQNSYEKLKKVSGSKFRFAIIADPQVNAQNNRAEVGYNAMIETERAAAEINAMNPRPDFIVHLGDLVNVFNHDSELNFRRLAGLFRSPNVLVHGNHDSHAPYSPFIHMQRDLTGIEMPYSSFDVGQWHFIITPCNLDGHSPEDVKMEVLLLDWLERDLEENKNKPVIFFNHLHFMPQGLSQTEFYHFPLPLRKKLLELITRYGNVKYYFNGHVHNGIQTAEKVAWDYKGTTFFTSPTIIQPRPYGEEFELFADGMQRGGHYLIVDVDGDDVIIRGRLSGVRDEYVFPEKFKPFSDEEYPRWFRLLGELPAAAALENGDFKNGLSGWLLPERYQHSTDPFFIAEAREYAGRNAAHFMIKSPVESVWCVDEYHEISQTLSVDPAQPLMLSGDYLIPAEYEAGGGYIAAFLMNGETFKGMMMFRWGKRERDSNYLPRCYGYMINGRQQSWLYFQNLGRDKLGMFWKLPDRLNEWHSLTADISALYDEGHGAGEYRKLGVNKVVFAAGIWNYTRQFGTKTEGCFSNLILKNGTCESKINGAVLAVTPETFTCEFGQALADELAEQKLEKYPVITSGNLIANGDFKELDSKTGWPLHWKKSRAHDLAGVSRDAVSAPYSLYINDNSTAPDQNAWWASDKAGAGENSAYEISWTWKYKNAADAALMVRYFDRSEKLIEQERFNAKGTLPSWTEQKKTIQTPVNCRLIDVVLCTSAAGTGEIWLDNLNMVKK